MNQEKQPQELSILFFSELWERFSFYGMRSLLVLYLTQQFLLQDSTAYAIYGAYTALVYGTSVLGGHVADRYLGYHRSIIIGGILIMCGHICLALTIHSIFFWGLSLITIGTGFFKPNISSYVGQMYSENDPRRESGFTIFYLGINIGSFLATLFCGIVAQYYGWHAGFAMAAVGMFLGLMNFIFRGKNLKQYDILTLTPSAFDNKKSTYIIILILSIVCLCASRYLITHNMYVHGLLGILAIISIIIMVRIAYRGDNKQRQHIKALFFLFIFAIVFFAMFEQAGSSLTLFTERVINRKIFDFIIPTASFQSLNPLFILIFAPLLSILWKYLASHRIEFSIPFKFSVGLLLAGLGFLVLVWGGQTLTHSGQMTMSWLVISYLLQTVGELCLSPIGLSAVTQLAPQGTTGLFMGIWFLASAIALNIAAFIATFTSISADSSTLAQHQIYMHVFLQVGLFGTGAALICFLLIPILRKWIHT